MQLARTGGGASSRNRPVIIIIIISIVSSSTTVRLGQARARGPKAAEEWSQNRRPNGVVSIIHNGRVGQEKLHQFSVVSGSGYVRGFKGELSHMGILAHGNRMLRSVQERPHGGGCHREE